MTFQAAIEFCLVSKVIFIIAAHNCHVHMQACWKGGGSAGAVLGLNVYFFWMIFNKIGHSARPRARVLAS